MLGRWLAGPAVGAWAELPPDAVPGALGEALDAALADLVRLAGNWQQRGVRRRPAFASDELAAAVRKGQKCGHIASGSWRN